MKFSKTYALMMIGSLLLLGCLGGPSVASPSPEPTATPSPVAGSVSIGEEYEKTAADNADLISELEDLTNQLDEAQFDLTDEELKALG